MSVRCWLADGCCYGGQFAEDARRSSGAGWQSVSWKVMGDSPVTLRLAFGFKQDGGQVASRKRGFFPSSAERSSDLLDFSVCQRPVLARGKVFIEYQRPHALAVQAHHFVVEVAEHALHLVITPFNDAQARRSGA